MKEKTSKRKSIFGPSKDEIWSQIATDIGVCGRSSSHSEVAYVDIVPRLPTAEKT